MKRVMLLLVLVLCTSYKPADEKKDFEYSIEIREIQDNIDQANEDLDHVDVYIKDKKRLQQAKDKMKKSRRNGS